MAKRRGKRNGKVGNGNFSTFAGQQTPSQFKAGLLQTIAAMIQTQVAARGWIDDPIQSEQRTRQYALDAKGTSETMRKFGGGKRVSYSPLARNFGKKIMNMGPNVPADVRLAAYEASKGNGSIPEAQIMDTLRAYTGVHKSGATSLNKFTNGVRHGLNQAWKMSLLVSQAQRGGVAGSIAGMEVTQQAVDKAESLTKNETVEKVATALADRLTKNPGLGLSILNAVGRGLRLGGAVGVIGQLAVAAGNSYYQNRQAAAAALKGTYDAAWQYGLRGSPGIARGERESISATVDAERGLIDRFKGYFGFNGDVEERKADRVRRQYQTISGGRAHAQSIGINVQAKIGAFAAARGKSPSDLSKFEIEQALNTDVVLKMRAAQESGQAYVYAANQVAAETSGKYLYPDVIGVNIPVPDVLNYFTTEEQKDAMRAGKREEFAQAYVRTQIARSQERNVAVENAMSQFTQPQMLQLQRAIRAGRAMEITQASRHKVKWDD